MNIQDKLCPFFKKECFPECALYDDKLENCNIRLQVYNLYRLNKVIGNLVVNLEKQSEKS